MSDNSKKRRLIFNKFDFIPFEELCSFLVGGEMFNLLIVSKEIRVKVYKAGSCHAVVNSFEIGERLMATFPKISLHAPNSLKNINDLQLITLPRLTELSLCNSYYSQKTITDHSLKYLTNLTRLHFWLNVFSGDGLTHLRKIKSLSLYYNSSVKDVHMKGLTTLTELSLADCPISDLGLSYLPNLKRLNLENFWRNSITGIGLQALTQLTSLSLQYINNIAEIDLIRLTNLRSLEMRKCNLINDFLSSMTFLEKLTIRDHIDRGDMSFRKFNRLTSLEIIYNDTLSGKGLGYLTNLKHLVLRDTKLQGKYLRNLTNITNLEIGSNYKIEPKHLINLSSVRTLVLYLNKTIDDEMVQALKNVHVIKIVCNHKDDFAITLDAFRLLNKLKTVIVRNQFPIRYKKLFNERGIELLRY
ncbi:MAG: hypothetical protein Harvfovirus22_4 [Harvfovirus sp.]|uniref:Leucine-rich repeat protein n=1 Tax=Harvfovirus sp. TaxID=2487768 RepID=A0A3G5A6Z4_9VIRU|nr:MAG: hypothetical protein Harvfovirus22_4 [Harvfovirus sp.]